MIKPIFTFFLRRPFGHILALACLATSAPAHVLPHFGWLHVERTVSIASGEVRVSHTCHLPSANHIEALDLLDEDNDSTVTQRELANYYSDAAKFLLEDLQVMTTGGLHQGKQEVFRVLPDNDGFESEIVVTIPEGIGEMLIIDPAFLLRPQNTPPTPATQLVLAPGITATYRGGDDEATTVPSTLRTILRLTHTSPARQTSSSNPE